MSRIMVQHGSETQVVVTFGERQKWNIGFYYYAIIEPESALNITQIPTPHLTSSTNITFMRLGVCTHYQK